jgi:hypothetical protein
MEYRLAEQALVFSTRDRGARLLAEVLEAIRTAPTEPVKLDFEGVLSASYSFLDEFVGKLAQAMHPAAPILINMPPAVASTIESSLRRRGLNPEQVLSASLEAA